MTRWAFLIYQIDIFTEFLFWLAFQNLESRLQFVKARLLAFSVLLYFNSEAHIEMKPEFVKELVDSLIKSENEYADVSVVILQTLTAAIYLGQDQE